MAGKVPAALLQASPCLSHCLKAQLQQKFISVDKPCLCFFSPPGTSEPSPLSVAQLFAR
jgi:hypothetical protein